MARPPAETSGFGVGLGPEPVHWARRSPSRETERRRWVLQGGGWPLPVVRGLVMAGLAVSSLAAQESRGTRSEPGELAQALSTRYRFVERYASTEDRARPEILTQYRVGVREVYRIAREQPQAAPQRDETTLQSIYTERIARVERGVVTDLVRRYDRVNLKTTLPLRPFKDRWLEGLTIWYRIRPNLNPEVLCLTPDRRLRQQEYERIIQQVVLPQLTTLFPANPIRVGDRWTLPRVAVRALLGPGLLVEDDQVQAELLEVRKTTGESLVAIFRVQGEVGSLEGPSALNAELDFAFVPAAADPAPNRVKPAARPAEGVLEARGFVQKLRLAQVNNVAAAVSEGRLKQTVTRELVLERRPADQAGGAGQTPPLEVPNPPPVPTEANSWLTYDDPQARFHFRHPQTLQVVRLYPDGGVDLLDRRPDGQDVVQLSLVPKTADSSRDRLASDPLQYKKMLMEQWKQQGEQVQMGTSGWLPEAEWAPRNRRVYRIEAALKPAAADGAVSPSGRIYLDSYLVQFTRNETMKVTALTTQEPHIEFRNQAESIIKSFEFGPSDASAADAP